MYFLDCSMLIAAVFLEISILCICQSNVNFIMPISLQLVKTKKTSYNIIYLEQQQAAERAAKYQKTHLEGDLCPNQDH